MKLDTFSNKQKQSGFIYENTNNAQVIGVGNPNDEYYTPPYAIKPILKYLKPSSLIWCPFDTDESHFISELRKDGHTVYGSHISDGYDFFTTEPKDRTDYIISNPPYSKKFEVINRLFELKIPFAMLVGIVGLFESQKRFFMFKKHKFEMMYFNLRISYFKDYKDPSPKLNPPFSSVYICSKLLPNQIIFEVIDKSTKEEKELPYKQLSFEL